MTKRRHELVRKVCLARGPDRRNRALLECLAHDDSRAELFERLNGWRLTWAFRFPSRVPVHAECDCVDLNLPLRPPAVGYVPVTLVTQRSKIDAILVNRNNEYSSRVYAELGGGSFMLALDPSSAKELHEGQRAAFHECFPKDAGRLQAVAYAATQAAAVMAFRAPNFDLADFGEQAALRCCQMLMGYSIKDYPLLEATMRAAYKALVYQVFERHFVTDPTLIPQAKIRMGLLLARTAQLIDAYAANAGKPANKMYDVDELKGCQDPAMPVGVPPVLRRLGEIESVLNGEQRAIVALGAAIGTVGNIQAAVCIVVKALFANRVAMADAQRLAADWRSGQPTDPARIAQWKDLLGPVLRANPPIPYLPRIRVDRQGNKIEEVLLALGGGTANTGRQGDDPLVWGFPTGAKHDCLGQALAWPVIIEIVRQVVALPGLAQARDPVNAKVKGLKKRHGFACESYPLTHRRDRWRAQMSLNVAMRIKAPIKDNVDSVRLAIAASAPRIEIVLRASRHVHFAWFEVIESDSVLVLHTVYDGPFDAYLQHFALQAGDLFDVLFEYIEDPPPMPVHQFPNEFVAYLLRYNRPPAMGYFFSAYPRSEVARIVRDEARRG
jgi:hypothetical protein